MRMLASVISIVAAVASVVFWGIFSFDNPYSQADSGGIQVLFIFMVIPSVIALVAQFVAKKVLLLIAFLSTLPISLYLAMTPGMFRWFGFVSVGYLISSLLVFYEERRKKGYS